MKLDAIINHMTHITGTSRKQVIEAIKELQNIPEVRRKLDRMKR